MDLNYFQERCHETAIHGLDGDDAINYAIIGLLGEAGEIANKWKKHLRGDNSNDDHATLQTRQDLLHELGDVLWYCAELSYHLNANLDLPANLVLAKLYARKARGTLRGSGDDR